MNSLVRLLQGLHYRNFSFLVKLMGGLNSAKNSYALAELLGKLRAHMGYVGAGWSREKYLKTIRTFFPNVGLSEAEALLKAYWVNHQKRFMELFLVRSLNASNLDKLVKFDGLERLDEALKRGNGVILPVPHIGNERLHHIALAVKGYPMAVISSKYTDHGSYARMIKLEASRQFHEVGHPGDGIWLLKMFKNNKVLQIAPDAEADANGVIVKFLSQEILLPTGWVRLAYKTEAAIFPSVLLRQQDGRHKLTILPEFKLTIMDDGKVNFKDTVQNYMEIVADIFRDNMDLIDWMNLTVRLEESGQTTPRN